MPSNPSTSSAEDSPATTSLKPESDEGSQVSGVAYGSSLPEWFAIFDPDSCSWRTSAISLFGDSQPSSETWPRSGMTRSGRAFLLPRLVPRIAVSASSSWPTPTARLGDQRRGMPSPELAARRYSSGRRNLEDAVAMYPTPTANDWKGAGYRNGKDGRRFLTLTGAARERSGKVHDRAASGHLSPDWVEWLMGLPPNWTVLDSEPSETP